MSKQPYTATEHRCGCGGQGNDGGAIPDGDDDRDCGGLPVVARPRFFPGQRLQDRDLEAIAGYARARLALRARFIGSGVVCGMNVRAERTPRGDVILVVDPGYAIDACGNDIVLSEPWRSAPIDDRCGNFGRLWSENRRRFTLVVCHALTGGGSVPTRSECGGGHACRDSRVIEGARFELRPEPTTIPTPAPAVTPASEALDTYRKVRTGLGTIADEADKQKQWSELSKLVELYPAPHVPVPLPPLTADRPKAEEVIHWLLVYWRNRAVRVAWHPCGTAAPPCVGLAGVWVERRTTGATLPRVIVDDMPPYRQDLGPPPERVGGQYTDLTLLLGRSKDDVKTDLIAKGYTVPDPVEATSITYIKEMLTGEDDKKPKDVIRDRIGDAPKTVKVEYSKDALGNPVADINVAP